MIEYLNKKIDMHLQDTYVARGLLLEGPEYEQLVLRVGQEYIKLKEICRDADFYIEEAIARAIEEIQHEDGIPRDYDRS